MEVGFAGGKAYIEIHDPVMPENISKKELDIVELYEMMLHEQKRLEKEVLFYRGVSNQWQDKYMYYKDGIDTAIRIMEFVKGD